MSNKNGPINVKCEIRELEVSTRCIYLSEKPKPVAYNK